MSDVGPEAGRGKSEEELRDMVAAGAWSLFRLWIASPRPLLAAAAIPALKSGDDCQVHLAFALFPAVTACPALSRPPRDRVPAAIGILPLMETTRRTLVDMVGFGNPAEASGNDFDWEMVEVQVRSERVVEQCIFARAP